jgi:hypothetical protein
VSRKDDLGEFNSKNRGMHGQQGEEGMIEKPGGIQARDVQLKPSQPIKQQKIASAWSHGYRKVQRGSDTYKFGKNLEGLTADYWKLISKVEATGKPYSDKQFPASWDSIRGNGDKDQRM